MTPDPAAVSDAGRRLAEGSPVEEEVQDEAEYAAGFRLLAHTADTAFEAWGPTRADCYRQAVRALVASFADVSGATLVDRVPVQFGPADHEDLLVDLLDEVIYILDTRGLVAARAELLDEEDGGLRGQLQLTTVESVQPSGAVPKAVTYHALRVDGSGAGWRCRVTLDV